MHKLIPAVMGLASLAAAAPALTTTTTTVDITSTLPAVIVTPTPVTVTVYPEATPTEVSNDTVDTDDTDDSEDLDPEWYASWKATQTFYPGLATPTAASNSDKMAKLEHNIKGLALLTALQAHSRVNELAKLPPKLAKAMPLLSLLPLLPNKVILPRGDDTTSTAIATAPSGVKLMRKEFDDLIDFVGDRVFSDKHRAKVQTWMTTHQEAAEVVSSLLDDVFGEGRASAYKSKSIEDYNIMEIAELMEELGADELEIIPSTRTATTSPAFAPTTMIASYVGGNLWSVKTAGPTGFTTLTTSASKSTVTQDVTVTREPLTEVATTTVEYTYVPSASVSAYFEDLEAGAN